MENGSKINHFEDTFFEIIIESENLDRTQINFISTVFSYLVTIKDYKAPYDKITDIIYNNIDDIKLSTIGQTVKERLDGINDVNKESFNIKSSIIRHVNLSVNQRMYIDKKSMSASKSAFNISEKAKQISKEANKVSKKAKRSSKKAKNIKEKIYTDFISILGIFTAITFATFGGLQLLSNIFQNVKFSNLQNLGGSVFLGSYYIIGIYLIIIVLLTGTKKLSKKDSEYIISENIKKIIYRSCNTMGLIGLCIYLLGAIISL